MSTGDLNKVWETRALKRKPREEEARKFLEKIAAQVQPIMAKHKWKVKLLSEFCPKNLLGLNIGGGEHVKLRLRRYKKDEEFLPFDEVLDTMLHELCHNVHGPHNASFYKLWDELRKECEDLIREGISGSGKGFDLPGRRLGGFKPQPPLSFLRQTAFAAAEKRVLLGSLLPSGPQRLGGDSLMMTALSPSQAAAMAAERRLRDNIWCGSECYDASEDKGEENNDQNPLNMAHSYQNSRVFSSFDGQTSNVISRKRSRGLNEMTYSLPCNDHPDTNFVDLTTGTSVSESIIHRHGKPTKKINRPEDLHAPPPNADLKSSKVDLTSDISPSRSVCGNDLSTTEDSTMWECGTCTLLNPTLASICELCSSRKPKEVDGKQKFWSCKFCTLDNVVELERCAACGEWRYSLRLPCG